MNNGPKMIDLTSAHDLRGGGFEVLVCRCNFNLLYFLSSGRGQKVHPVNDIWHTSVAVTGLNLVFVIPLANVSNDYG